APQIRCARQPVTFRLHPDNFGVRMLSDLTDQRLAVALRHPVPWFDALVAFNGAVEVFLQCLVVGVLGDRAHRQSPFGCLATSVRTSYFATDSPFWFVTSTSHRTSPCSASKRGVICLAVIVTVISSSG